MKTSSKNHINKHWLVFANAKRCNHYASLAMIYYGRSKFGSIKDVNFKEIS